jgi:Holliday junction resolvase
MEHGKRYKFGARFEYELASHFKKRGWQVIRSAGSHSYIDLVVFVPPQDAENPDDKGEVLVIQCKSSQKIVTFRQIFSDESIKLFESESFVVNAVKLIFVKEGTGREINRYFYRMFPWENKWTLIDSSSHYYKYYMEKVGTGYDK